MIDPANRSAVVAGLERVGPLGAVMAALGDARDGVHLVGGAARDLLLECEAFEVDLVADRDPAVLAEVLAKGLGGESVTHGRFGTAKVTWAGGEVDLARARTETYRHPGALPDVRPATLEEDLGRRDFTVNAIAISLDPQSLGAVVAFPGALADLREGTIRVLHDASFGDDPTRLWRMCRYAARLDFELDAATSRLAHGAVESGALRTISSDRQGAELLKLVDGRESAGALDLAEAYGLLGAIGATGWDRGLLDRATAILGERPAGPRLKLATCFVGAGDAPERAASLGIDRDLRRLIEQSANAPSLAESMAGAGSRSRVYGMLAPLEPEAIALAGALGGAETARQWFDGLRDQRPLVTGEDLRSAGAAEGPGIAVGLRAALELQLDSGIEDRDRLIEASLAAIDRDGRA